MKAPNGVCFLILLILITKCELKIQKLVVDNKKVTIETDFLAELKEELGVPPLPVPETDIFSAVYDLQSDVSSPNQSVTEDTTIKLNCKMNTLALTALHQNSKVKVCCPKSLNEWKKKHKMEISQQTNCKVKVAEPEKKRQERQKK